MRSFDLFDTLVAAKNARPSGNFLDQLIPIAENIRQVGPDDIIVSDYFNPSGAMKALREIAGLSNRLIVTDHDKYSGVIWPTLHVESHLGDNPVADYEQPLKHGIKAEITDVSQLTPIEIYLKDNGLETLALACREARLRTFHDTLRSLQLLQIEANFPLLLLSGIHLHHFAERVGLKRLLMSARDCYMWIELQRDICSRLGGHYECVYFPSSRICRNVPSNAYLAYVKKQLEIPCAFVDIAGTGKSLVRLAKATEPMAWCWIVTKYDWVNVDGFGPIDLSTVVNLVNVSNNLIERVNPAPHAMYVDLDETMEGDEVWASSSEVKVMHDAFRTATEVMRNYELPGLADIEVLYRLFSEMDQYHNSLLPILTLMHGEENERVRLGG